jgi:hypothetical protein
MNAPQAVVALPALGEPFAGGIFAGRFFVDAVAYALVIAPKDEGEFPATIWNKSYDKVAGALSVYDGPLNTDAMAEAGSALAKKIGKLDIGGFKDWYLPSRGELLLAYAANLKGAEAFERGWYWSSTQHADDAAWAWYQHFNYGYQIYDGKSSKLRARAVRRVPI